MPFDFSLFIQTTPQVKHIKHIEHKKITKNEDEKIAKLRRMLIETAKEIELNLNSFLSNPPNPKVNRDLYSYYLLTNAKQVAIDYFPNEFNSQYIPLINKVLQKLKPKAQKEYQRLPSINEIIAEYISRAKCYFCRIGNNEKILRQNFADISNKFNNEIQNSLKKLQELEIRYFAKELAPQNPKDKEVAYLSIVVQNNPPLKKDLRKPIKLLLAYIENKPIKRNILNEYKFYIERLEENTDGFQY